MLRVKVPAKPNWQIEKKHAGTWWFTGPTADVKRSAMEPGGAVLGYCDWARQPFGFAGVLSLGEIAIWVCYSTVTG